MKRRFIQCDVFSNKPFKGNGLAVVLDGEGLSTEQMQEFARWTNLAETTFLLPPTKPEADYQLRIFSPGREMPFAGHPTLGSCAAWLHCGGKPKDSERVYQQCQVGIVEINLSGAAPAFKAPPTIIETLPDHDLAHLLKGLGIDKSQVKHSARLDNGPIWQLLELHSVEQVLAVNSMRVRWPEYKTIGLLGAYPAHQECDYEVRLLAPSSGMSEDPVTGSLNSAIAHWLQSQGRLSQPLVMSQGRGVNREGRIFINPDLQDDSQVLIGGHSQIVIEGHIYL